MLGHADWVNDLALRPELLASCSSDRTVRLWRPEGAHAHHTQESYEPLTPDGECLRCEASCSSDRTVRLWRPEGAHSHYTRIPTNP